MKLVEVGTTNKTRIDDYKGALKNNPNAILLKVHRSNFSISGFTEEVNIKQLNILKNEYESFLIHDLGSGLVAENAFLSKTQSNNVSKRTKSSAIIKRWFRHCYVFRG